MSNRYFGTVSENYYESLLDQDLSRFSTPTFSEVTTNEITASNVTSVTSEATTAKIGTIIFPTGTANDFQYDQTTPTDGWTDIECPIEVRGVGANDPSFAVFRNGIRAFEFPGSGSSMREVFAQIHIPHQLTPGTGIYFHVHYSPNAAAPAGTVQFNFEYTYAGPYSDVFPPTQVATATSTLTTQYQHIISETTLPLLAGSLEVDGLILLRVWRDAALDTSTDSVFLHFVDCHINVSKISTKYRNKATGSFYA